MSAEIPKPGRERNSQPLVFFMPEQDDITVFRRCLLYNPAGAVRASVINANNGKIAIRRQKVVLERKPVLKQRPYIFLFVVTGQQDYKISHIRHVSYDRFSLSRIFPNRNFLRKKSMKNEDPNDAHLLKSSGKSSAS
jgi:hypothetical protein